MSCSIVLKCFFGSRSVIDSAHNMDADGEVLPDAVAPESPGPEVEAAKRGRGRPRKSVSSSNLGDSEKEGIPKKAKAKASSAKEGKSGKVQCMGCGKLIDRKLMANLRYCHDDKLITDRLYKAAKAQDRTTWLSEQLSSIESTQRLIAAYKLRFPQWKTERADNKRFLTQYVEMVQAETAILYEGDGVMLTEDKFVMHMAKAENGGFSGQKARVEFARLLQDPTTVKDKKHGLDRVRVDLEDHVRFQNKFSKLKQLIQ